MNTHAQNDILLSWEAPAKPNHDRSERWYVIAGICAAMLIVYGMVSGSWIMSFCLAVSAGLYYLVRNEKHPQHTISIMSLGINFNGRLHPWNDFKHFWMLSGSDYCDLHIACKRRLGGDICIQTGDMDPYKIRDLLSEFMPQDPHKRENILDAIIRFCKL